LLREEVDVRSVPDECRPDPDLELEALVRLAGARDLLDHVVVGDVVPQALVIAARQLVEKAERLLVLAP
jgi:hypothetical protein